MPPSTDALAGEVIADRFRITARLGQGGMGTVYRAEDLDRGHQVALKLLQAPRGAEDVTRERAARRFVREMKVTERIDHPNTVEVYDYGTTGSGVLYLAMELLEGRTLTRVLRDEAPLDDARIAHIATQIAKALAAAHAEGIIHRDLKPGNVFLVEQGTRRDVVKILDFGIARFSEPADDEEAAALTSTGMLVGTPLYLAPEYISDSRLDHRADLYALGVLMFEMATGQVPFRGTPGRVMSMAVQSQPPDPQSLVGHPLPAWLAGCIHLLMSKDPERRPDSAQHVVDLLARREEPAPRPPPAATSPVQLAMAAAGGALLVIAVALVLFLAWRALAG